MPSEHVTIYAEFVEDPHTITIDSMTNGTVTVDRNLTQAIEGTTINLTVTPDPGFQLTPGSLKYSGTANTNIPITNNSFTMPNENVTIYAEFETTPQSITSISPAFGSTSVITQVIITGSGFLDKSNLTVTFGSASATSVTVDSDNQITCTAPAQSAGAVDVVVSSTVGSSNAVSFYYCTADTLSIFETIAGFNALTGKTLTTALTESNTVTITGDAKGVSSSLVLNIPSGVTVKWAATITTSSTSIELIKLSGSGTFEVVYGSGISATGTSNSSIPIYVSGSGLVIIRGGTVSTGNLAYAIYLYNANSAAVVTGGTITAGTNGTPIRAMYTTAKGYYTGDHVGLFAQGFSSSNLFKLDEVKLTSNSQPYDYDTDGPKSEVIATLENMTTVTSISANGARGSYTSGNKTFTFNQPVNSQSITLDVEGSVTVNSQSIPLSFTTDSFSVNVDTTLLSINSISPAFGPIAGGTEVTITGANLDLASGVKVGSNTVASTSFSDQTNTTIKFDIPQTATAGEVDLLVTSSNRDSNIVKFTYYDTPIITDISPNYGLTKGNGAVTLTGIGLDSVTKVTIGDNDVTSFTSQTGTEITFNTPAHDWGKVDVAVTNSAGTTTQTGAFTYVPNVNIVRIFENTNDIGLVAELEDESIVKITGTATFETSFNLNIRSGVTVKWEATLTYAGGPYTMGIDGDGTFEVIGGSISNSGTSPAITASETVTVIVSGGMVSANSYYAIAILRDTNVLVIDGTVTSSGSSVIYADADSTGNIVLLNGSAVGAGKITKHADSTATGYYIGTYGTTFSTDFSSGNNNLFALDKVTFMAGGADYNGTDLTYFDVTAKLPDILDLTGAAVTVTGTDGSNYIENSDNSVTFNKQMLGVTGIAIKAIDAKFGGTALPEITSQTFGINISKTLSGTVSVTDINGGNIEVGDTLTANVDGIIPAAANGRPALEYQWQYSADGSINWTDISNATSESYTVTLENSNKYIRVEVKAIATSGFTGTVDSNPVKVIKAAMQGSVSITVGNEGGGTAGVAEMGDVLSVDISGIIPAAAQTGVTYLWGGGDTSSATTSTYTVTQNDENTHATINVTVTAAETGDYTGSLSTSVMADRILVDINGLSIANNTYTGGVHQGYTGNPGFTLDSSGGSVTPNNTVLTALYTGTANDSSTYNAVTPPTKAGSYIITVMLANDLLYYGEWIDVFEISKATPSYIVPTGLTATYGQTLSNIDLSAHTGFSWEDPSTSVGRAGNSTFAATYTPADISNYNTASVDIWVSINSLPVTITPNAGQSKKYGAADPVFNYTPNPALISGDSFSGTLSRAVGEDVGTYAYNLGSLSIINNYTLTFAAGNTFTITPAVFNGTLPAVTRYAYNGNVCTITISTSELIPTPEDGKSLGTVSGYTLESYNAGNISSSAKITNGNLTITCKNNAKGTNTNETIKVRVSTQNYGDIIVSVTLQTVDKTDVSDNIEFADSSADYSGYEQTYETAVINGITSGANPTWIFTYMAGTGTLGANNKPLTAGTYTVTATYEDDINIGTKTAEFTINKAEQTAPAAPVPDSRTADSITLRKPGGMTADAEYMQGPSGTWQTIADFSGLTPNTAYSFYMRLAETANYKASPASPAISVTTEKAALTGTVTISGTAKFNQTLTAQTVSLTTDPAGAEKGTLSYQWKRSGTAIAGANNATYVIMGADIDKTITVTVTTLNCIGEVTSSATLVVGKADAPNITWPTANGVTYGQTLSDSTLSFTSSEYGTFAWTDPSISPVRNNNGYSVTFTPFNDTIANYETITITTQPVAVDVAAKNVSSLTIEPIAAVTYNGTPHEPIPDQDIIVKDGNTTLTSVTDYTVTYSSNIFAGTATVTITGEGNYTGIKEEDFIIYKATPAQLTWPAASDLTYGAALSMSNLTGGSTTGTWAWTDSSLIPTVINSGYNVTFTPADTANYDWSGVTLTQAVNILVSKASGLTVSTEPAMNAREGIGPARNYSFDMNNIILNKGDTGVKTYSAVKDTDGNNILNNITVTNNILTYDIAGTAAVGDTATIAITIKSDNYTDITAMLTITVTIKDTQTIRFQEAALTTTYGNAKFTAAAALDGSGGTGAVTYTSDNTSVATVNAATGEVTIVGVGLANITAIKAEDADWFEATASYTLTVTKASQTAPGGIGKTNETAAGANDGTMTGVTTAMEYKRNTDTVYTPIPGTTVTELPPGTYYVRYASTTNHNPGPDTVITIAAYTAPITETPSSDSKGSIVENNHYGTAPEAPKFWGAVNTDIGKDISANTEDSNYNVVTGRNIVIPTFILETLQDSNTTLAMHTGMGVTFSITGSDIPDHTNIGTTVNLTVRQGELTAPEALIREKTKDTIRSIEIPMESHESFGMTVNVHFSLGTENADNYANLYRYNEQTGAFEYLGSYQINEDGQAMFGITGGADFLLTVTAEKPNEVIVPMSGETYIVKPGDTLSGTAVKYGMSVAQIMALNPEIKNSSRIRPGQKIRVR